MTATSTAKRATSSSRSGTRATWARASFAAFLAVAGVIAACASTTPTEQHPQQATGCPHGQGPTCAPSTVGSTHGGMLAMNMDADCPMRVEGTKAHAVDVDGGVALEFTTTGDVAELRRRVAKMAEMHAGGGMMHDHAMMGGGMMADGGAMHDHAMMSDGMMADGGMMHDHAMMGGGMMGGGMHDHAMMGGGMMGGGMMPPATVRAEDTPQGARLVFTPKDPKDLDALRQHQRMHAEHANAGTCPMLEMHGGPTPKAPPATSAAPGTG